MMEEGLLAPMTPAPAVALPALEGGSMIVPPPGARGPSLLVFFKESCPTCRLALPIVDRLHRHVARKGAMVVGISQDPPSTAEALRVELGLSIPILIDAPDLSASETYALVSVPTFYLIDKAGRVRERGVGFRRDALAALGRTIAAGVGVDPPRLWERDDDIPEWQPG